MYKSFGINNIKLLDDNGFPLSFNNVDEVINSYFNEMIKIYNLMIQNRIKQLKLSLENFEYHLKLIKLINNRSIIIIDEKGAKSKKEIQLQIEQNNIPIKYIDNIKITECTDEDIEEYENIIQQQNIKINEASCNFAEELWINDLTNLKKFLLKNYVFNK